MYLILGVPLLGKKKNVVPSAQSFPFCGIWKRWLIRNLILFFLERLQPNSNTLLVAFGGKHLPLYQGPTLESVTIKLFENNLILWNPKTHLNLSLGCWVVPQGLPPLCLSGSTHTFVFMYTFQELDFVKILSTLIEHYSICFSFSLFC